MVITKPFSYQAETTTDAIIPTPPETQTNSETSAKKRTSMEDLQLHLSLCSVYHLLSFASSILSLVRLISGVSTLSEVVSSSLDLPFPAARPCSSLTSAAQIWNTPLQVIALYQK